MGMDQTVAGQAGAIPQIALSPGDVVGNYTIKGKLGQGGFASVYHATENLIGKDRALKVLPMISRDYVKNILLEFESRERIRDIDHIIKAWQPQQAVHAGQDVVIYPMELADMTFRQWLSQHRNQPEVIMGQGMELFKQACRGVEAIHNAGLTHLDIKPENILLVKDTASKGHLVAKIADFGLARGVGMETLSALEDGMGTPAYMAPEQIMAARWKDVGPEADIYALGMILYEMIDGDLPYSGTPKQIKEKKRDKDIDIAALKQDTPTARTAMKSISRNPGKRPASVSEFIAQLEGKGTKSDPPAEKTKRTEEAPKPTKAAKPAPPETVEEAKQQTLEVTITSQPEGAKLYVDKALAGTTPARLHLVMGAHTLKLVKGSITIEETILVAMGSPTEFAFELEDTSTFTETTDNLNLEMILVEGGSFTMGATPEQEPDADSREKPAHKVTLSDYYVGKYPVTQKQWQAVIGENPSSFKGNDRPVESVSWDDAQQFLFKLNKRTGKNYRLPTEAEWEYAARGGKESRGYRYSGSDNLSDVGWFSDNSGSETQPVGCKKANELGIHDMSGNVWEWCNDWYDDSYYKTSPERNPQGPSSGSDRVRRGGSWYDDARRCRVADRDYFSPGIRNLNLGFRLVLPK